MSQPFKLLPLDLVQLGSDTMIKNLQLLCNGAISDLINFGFLQFFSELWVTLKNLDDLLQIFVVLKSQIPFLSGLILLWSCKKTQLTIKKWIYLMFVTYNKYSLEFLKFQWSLIRIGIFGLNISFEYFPIFHRLPQKSMSKPLVNVFIVLFC